VQVLRRADARGADVVHVDLAQGALGDRRVVVQVRHRTHAERVANRDHESAALDAVPKLVVVVAARIAREAVAHHSRRIAEQANGLWRAAVALRQKLRWPHERELTQHEFGDERAQAHIEERKVGPAANARREARRQRVFEDQESGEQAGCETERELEVEPAEGLKEDQEQRAREHGRAEQFAQRREVQLRASAAAPSAQLESDREDD